MSTVLCAFLRIASLCFIGLATLVALPRQGRAEVLVVEGPRVVVRSSLASKATAERCRDVLEAAIPIYEAHLPYRLPAGEKLVVHLHATSEEFAAAVTAGGASALARNGAATLHATNESHVVMGPRAEEPFLALVGHLPEMTRFVVCHEGVHQFVRRAGAHGCNLWPDWYDEGMAEHLATACCIPQRAPGTAGPAAMPVHVDDKRYRVIEALAKGKNLSVARLLHAEQFTVRDLPSVYSHWGELYRFLAADPARLKRLHEGIAALGLPGEPGAGARDDRKLRHAEACAKVLERTYGPLEEIEAAWKRQTSATQPRWYEPFRATEQIGEELICAGFLDSNAIVASATASPLRPFTLSLELNILAVADRQADVYLGLDRRDELRFLKLAFGTSGFVTLLVYSDGFWQERYRANAAIAPGMLSTETWVPVRVSADREQLRIDIGGKRAFDARIPPGFDVLGGGWGLGATDAVVRFRKISMIANEK